ncbi:hypothetical protein [Arthrobacter sp. NEB 688]|uniref:hypothetical protein n=1 Tax=Arthrobacter sp. NEB 688 TaxID=904039 RepID=UPI001564817E|nr:hypothetical protein [Arthrobacter sp. NEB 688]QKE83039.1 hypothetical protein HL663_03085 [Arthrobacter sp. NEB 688]
MAAGLSAARPHPPTVASDGPSRTDTVRRVLLGASVALLLVVGLARPNAAQPDLAPRGWAPGTLVPLDLSPAVVTGVLWAAYLVGAAAVVLGLRSGTPALRGWRVPGALAVAALLTAPFGSADHVSYVAYGRILATGGNPWVESPAAWMGGADPVTSRVEAPWTEEPSVYGPFATLLHGLSAIVGGPQLRQEVWVWQVVVVLSWLAARWALRTSLPARLHGRVDAAWTLNPLVLGAGVLGAHVDVVAAALLVVAVALLVRVPGPVGLVGAGGVLALAASTKVTYGVGLLAVAAALWLVRERSAPAVATVRRVALLVGGFVLVAGLLQLWGGSHVYDQLLRSRQAVSLATPWRPLLEALRPSLGNADARTLVSPGAALLAVVLAVLLGRASRGVVRADDPAPHRLAATALRWTAVLSLAYSLAAPYSLPWYDVLVWAALPALAAGWVDRLALARLLVMCLAYVPGRVLGMTPGVESVTLGLRREVAPWLSLGVWLAAVGVSVAVGRRGSARSSASPPAGTPPTRTR